MPWLCPSIVRHFETRRPVPRYGSASWTCLRWRRPDVAVLPPASVRLVTRTTCRTSSERNLLYLPRLGPSTRVPLKPDTAYHWLVALSFDNELQCQPDTSDAGERGASNGRHSTHV